MSTGISPQEQPHFIELKPCAPAAHRKEYKSVSCYSFWDCRSTYKLLHPVLQWFPSALLCSQPLPSLASLPCLVTLPLARVLPAAQAQTTATTIPSGLTAVPMSPTPTRLVASTLSPGVATATSSVERAGTPAPIGQSNSPESLA